jgi:hypothetical protein
MERRCFILGARKGQIRAFSCPEGRRPQQIDSRRNTVDYVVKKADQAERGVNQEASNPHTSFSPRHLNPEDIELARKRAEFSLYLEKAAELEKEFSSLRGSLIEFSARFTRLIGSRGANREVPAATNVREFAAGRQAAVKATPFSVRGIPSKTDAGIAFAGRARGTDNSEKYLAFVTAICDELRSDAMTALLGEDILRGQEIPQAAFTLITGSSSARCTDQPVDSTGNRTGAELILVIRKIYAARERILFIHRGTMKLQFSMLYQLMTEVQRAGEDNVDLLGSIAESL